MAEKMNDITFPSQSKEKQENVVEKKRINKKWILIPCLFLIAFCGYLYFRAYRVEVKVWPITENFSESKTLIVRALDKESDLIVEVFEEIIEGSREFVVVGRSVIENKTKGIINVCQEHSDLPQSLVANTRFVSTDGKLFLAESRITVPGRRYEGGKIVPGCTVVSVVAAEAGEEYNIASSSKFSLPALQGTALYGRFFGDSFSITKEGMRKEVPSISADEIIRAEGILLDELFEKGIESLKERFSDRFTLDSRGQYSRWVIERSAPREGDQTDVFQMEMKIRIEVIAVSLESIESFAKKLLPEGYEWYEKSKSMHYDFPRTNFEEKSAEMDITVTALMYEEINIESLKRELSGMSFDNALYKLKRMEGISDASLKFLPFGPSVVVNNERRVDIELMFDKN